MSVIPRLCGAAAIVVLAASAEAKNLPPAAAPRRIVSMNLCADELVLRLAERDRIAAVTWLARDPRGSTVSTEAAGLPAIHGLAEQIAGLKPDLVVAGVFTTRVAVGLLKRLHFPLVELGSPGDFEALRAQIRELAARLGVIDKGEALVAELDDRLAAAIPARPTGLRVLVMRPNALTVSPGSFGDAIIRAAGLVNVAAELGRGGAGQIPIEIAVSANADLIVIDADDGLPSLATVLLRHPVFRRLAEEGRVVSIPNRLWTCPGPQAAEVVSRLAQAAGARIARQAPVISRPQSYGLYGTEPISHPSPHPEVLTQSVGLEGGLQKPLRSLEPSFEAADAAPQDEGQGGKPESGPVPNRIREARSGQPSP